MNHRILVRFTMPNERGSKQKCDLCNVKFQRLMESQHQCKRCLRSVCEKCGPERRIVYDADGSDSPHRCCTVCIKQIDDIEQYRSRFKLCFSQDSEFVQEWTNRLNKDRLDYDNILNQFSDNVTSVTNENTIRFKRQSEIIVHDLMEGYNYSLRHFIRVITDGLDPKIIQKKLRNVMIAIFARIKTLPYIPELIYLAMFFLCFANEAHTYFIITRMIQKIYPQYVRVNKMQKDNLLASTLKTILEMYRVCVGKVDRNELEIIAQYLEARFIVYALSFTLNVCSMPSSFFIINEMLKTGSCLPFYKGIAAMISYVREEVASFKSFSEIEIPILRSVNEEKLRSCFIQFEKSDSKFQVTNEIFDSVEHRKLHEKYKQMQSLYEKSEKSLNEKETKLKEILSELNLKKKQLDIENQKNRKLQLDLLKLSSNLPSLSKFEEMSQLYETTLARNASLEQKCAELEQLAHKLQKEKLAEERYRKNWPKLEDQYNREIVELKTRNQIMQIQLSAKEIDFNTSFLEKRNQEKNVQILMLKQEIKHLKQEMEFYKLKILEKSYSRHGKQSLSKNFLINSKEVEREKQFEKHIQNSNELVENLSKQLEQVKKTQEQHIKKIQVLQQTKNLLENKIKQIEEIRKVIQEIPQDYNYIEAIEQIERAAQRETNFMKKKVLQSIKDSFNKCYKQLRFRNIDCKIKEDKIKNSVLVNLFNPDNINQLKKASQQQNEDLFAFLRNVDEQKINEINDNNNKNCSMM